MIGSLEILNDLKEISTCLVGLPNRSRVVATNKGSIELNGNLVLSNVLYAAGLSCNVISVSQIIDEIDCVIAFSRQMCVV